MSEPRLNAQNWALLITLSAIWGGSFLFARIAVQEVPPLTLVFARVALAALTLNLILTLRRSAWVQSKAMWGNFAIMGILNNIIPFSLIFYGQTEIGAGLAAIINAMTPVWTVIFAHWATGDEKMTANKMVGIVLGFVGVAVLIGTAALAGFSGSVWGQACVLGATISYGIAGVFGRRFAKVPPLQTARGQLTMSSVFMLPICLLIDQPWSLAMPSAPTIWSTLALAIVCTALAYILFFRILATAGAVNVSLVTFLVPPFAIILGTLVLGEILQLRHYTGMALIIAGLIVIDGRLLKGN